MSTRKRDHFQRLQKQRYHARRYQNPYFRRDKPLRWKGWAVGIALSTTVVGLLWFFFKAPMFTIETVSVSGTQSIPPADIERIAVGYLEQARWGVFRASNRFLFRANELEKELTQQYAFESLVVEVEDQHVTISVREKTSQLIWQSGVERFLVDLQGQVIRPLNEAEIASLEAPPTLPPTPAGYTESTTNPLIRLPVCVDINGTPVTISSSVISPEEIQGVMAFADQIQRVGLHIKQTIFDRQAGKWTSAVTTEGFDVLFDPVADIPSQVVRLETVLREEIPDRTGLQYIDLRFGDHVYFKIE